MSRFNVSLIVSAKSRDSVHKPQILKRKESRSGSTPGPSAYQPGSLFLGQIGSRLECRKHWALRPQKLLRLIRNGEIGGSGILYLTPTRYTVTTRMILRKGGQLCEPF